jgi:hypothetical protein
LLRRITPQRAIPTQELVSIEEQDIQHNAPQAEGKGLRSWWDIDVAPV